MQQDNGTERVVRIIAALLQSRPLADQCISKGSSEEAQTVLTAAVQVFFTACDDLEESFDSSVPAVQPAEPSSPPLSSAEAPAQQGSGDDVDMEAEEVTSDVHPQAADK